MPGAKPFELVFDTCACAYPITRVFKALEMASKFSEIEDVFKTLKSKYYLKSQKINDYVYHVSNGRVGIIFMFERFEDGFSAFLKDMIEDKQYPIWKVFEIKGKPKIDIDFSLSKLRRNLTWHERFFLNILRKSLMAILAAYY